MLGKGLESLIPPRHSSGQAPQGGSTGANALPQQAHQDATEEHARPFVPPQGTASEPAPVRKEAPPVKDGEWLPKRYVQKTRTTAEGDAVFHIEVEKIKPNPHQPRRDFNEEHLRELADSIREFGILQPLVVTKIEKETPTGTDVEYELIAGERRLMASKLLGLPHVPVIVRKVGEDHERLELAIIENLQRQNLSPIETARAMARLQDDFRMTQREIAARVGKSREAVANTLRLLDLPSYIQDAVGQGKISESHARLLLTVDDPVSQEALFRDLLDRHLSTRELQSRVHIAKGRSPRAQAESAPHVLSPELKMLQERLSSDLGAPVKIEKSGESGKVSIVFYSDEELQSIIQKLERREEI